MNSFVFFLPITDKVDYGHLSLYAKFVSEERRDRLERITSEKDRCNSLLAELLARYALKRSLMLDQAQIVLAHDELGKPYFDGIADAFLSISHTDGCVAVAIGETRVGVDVERLRPVKLQLADRYFDPRETSRIYAEDDREAAFMEIWTKKEAYLKMLGTGLRKPLAFFCVFDDALRAKFITRRLGGHIISFCSDAENMEVAFSEVTLEQLLSSFPNA